MGSGFAKMKKQQRSMQAQISDMQKIMEEKEVEGVSAGGLVKITLSGVKAFKKISIDPSCVDPTDVEGLEDLIASAFKDAEKKASEEMSPEGMGKFF
jgi:DNA-binding YbaB/EbfC family protein